MENRNQRLLLVEDDQNFGSVLKVYLEMNGYDVCWVDDGARAFDVYSNGSFHLCILDIMLPGQDGFQLARQFRKQNAYIPFIFLTARTLKEDVVKGYRLGADDYIKKPFDSEVLLLKIQAILKRKNDIHLSEKKISYHIGRYFFDSQTRVLTIDKAEHKLSPKEALLLDYLFQRNNQLVERSDILKKIWKEDSYFTRRSMDVYITKLRKYLYDDPSVKIITVHGSGFKLETAKQ